MAEVEIYSASLCPFAHRTRLVLLEKGIDFKLTEIDLENKPGWLADVSPYGKVPAIKHGDNRIWESAIINEYLEEVFPEPPLMSSDPGKRAIARIWIDFANTQLFTASKLLLIQQPQQQEWAQQLRDHLLFMEQEGLGKLSGNGPYWFGETLSLVDLTFYPWFDQWPVLKHSRGLTLPSECLRLQKWRQVMGDRHAVKAIANPQDFYIQQYAKMGQRRGITAREIRQA